MNIRKLWNEILALTRQAGVEDVAIRFVDENGALVERQTSMKKLTEDSLNDGITLDTGETIFPNPTTAIFNPFLHRPVISFICDINRRPFDPIFVSDKEDASLVPSIFPVIVAGRPILGSDLAPSPIALSSVCPVLSFPAGFDPQPLQPQRQPQQPTEETITSQPERAYRGTSCHQCKNARSLDHLAFCSNLFNRRSRQDKRHCRKKYCDGCLAKCYGDSIANSKQPGWICPSCAGICRCAACTRIRRKGKSDMFQTMPFALEDTTNSLMSGGAPSLPDVVVAEEADLSIETQLLPEGIGKSLKDPLSPFNDNQNLQAEITSV